MYNLALQSRVAAPEQDCDRTQISENANSNEEEERDNLNWSGDAGNMIIGQVPSEELSPDIDQFRHDLDDSLLQLSDEVLENDGAMTMEELTRKWLLCQYGHLCSDNVANLFFDLAMKHCDSFMKLKHERKGKSLKLHQLRKSMTKNLIPAIKMDFIYHDRSIDEDKREEKAVHVMNVSKQPVKDYPPDKFDLVSQVTKVHPRHIIELHQRVCAKHKYPEKVIMSVDGVAETKSTSRSLEIMSIKFPDCQEVYPCLIYRPEVYQKKANKPIFEAYISNFLDELIECSVKLDKVVGDAPERAFLRNLKLHGGYFSCDLCLANPESISNGGKGSKLIPSSFLFC